MNAAASRLQNTHPKKSPESKKSMVLVSPKGKVSQTMRVSTLEQRLKDRNSRASSVKFYNNSASSTQNVTQKPAALPKIQKVSVSNQKMSKAHSQKQPLDALKGVLVNAWQENDTTPLKQPAAAAVMTSRNESLPIAAPTAPQAPLAPLTSPMKSLNTKAVVVDNRFEIKKKIDEGTYAKVYQALDWNQGGKEVVIKILRQRAYTRAKDKA